MEIGGGGDGGDDDWCPVFFFLIFFFKTSTFRPPHFQPHTIPDLYRVYLVGSWSVLVFMKRIKMDEDCWCIAVRYEQI